jgi:hypothetical protein
MLGSAFRTRIALAVAIPVGLALVLVAPPVSAEPTLQGAAYKVLKKYMNAYNDAGFADVVKIGDLKTYRDTLSSVQVTVDPTLKAVAAYDPSTNTIKFSKDPRRISANDAMGAGETVWHELSHAIEDAHGDIGVFDSEAYAERNVDYMTSITRTALPALEQMERRAENGVGPAKLAPYWAKFMERVAAAAKLPSTSKYPVDPTALQQWFGFAANPAAIQELYQSGKALPGKAGKALAEVFNPVPSGPNRMLFSVESIQGVSNGPTAPTVFSLAGPALITSIMTYHYFNHGAQPGTIGLRAADGKMYGPWHTTGSDGQGGVANANWTARPRTVIPAGQYTVVDSDPSTWSWAADTGGKGITFIKGSS